MENSSRSVNESNKGTDKYRTFKQLINMFYYTASDKEEKQIKTEKPYSIKIEPKIIYNSFQNTFKVELRIGDKQLYKLKNLPEFYDRMLQNESYKYGTKLEFIHTEYAFNKESLPLLEYILKYAEIIKYANKIKGKYSSYSSIDNDYITIDNSGIDELFEILKGKKVDIYKDYEDKKIYFKEEEPNIKFDIIKLENDEYAITSDIDIYEYEVIKGKEYIYFLYNDILYRCNKDFENTTLKLLELYKNNYAKQIIFREEDLQKLFSIVFPKLKNNICIDKLEKEHIEKYFPKELFVKVFLDFDEHNHVIADIKFIYGDFEFNPIIQENLDIARDIAKENEFLDIFIKTGFMLDKVNRRLILAQEEKIYQFLTEDINMYMQKFEVLATDSFKKRDVQSPKLGSVGVRIDNNLLSIDFSNLDFDLNELREVMNKYRLKKKYHRLKDGSFLSLEENISMDLLDGITQRIGIDYTQIQNGEIKLPVYRSMYLDRLLQNVKNTDIIKDENYKNLVKNINYNNIDDIIPIPKGINADLRLYQKVGFTWLSLLDRYNLGGILADDMGLGKTVQMLAVILSYIENTEKPKPSIVVCPSSLALNWESEIKKFAPSINTLVIHGNVEERISQIKSIEEYNIIVTSYDLLKRDIEIYKELNYEFKYIIADEAQYIKNNTTQNAKVIKEIRSDARYALTGTPIENSLSELWSIFDFIMPGYLFSYKKFKELYEIPIIKDNDENAMKKLKMLIEPFILRRIKKEVLTELPDKTVMVLNNEMQEEQKKIYASYMQKAKKEALREVDENGFERSQIKILALLMRLRQICCHPSLFINNYKGESSKLNQCVELVKDATRAGHKILIFSGYTSMFEIMEKELKKEKIKYFKLTGQTKVKDRMDLVDEFNNNEEIKVFLISLKAGGTGLNLIGADVVIHYDPWWNLSAENQATDRTYRIGQNKNVQVYKLITKNSIEERIYELQQKKDNLVNSVLSTDKKFINKLSKDDIMALFE